MKQSKYLAFAFPLLALAACNPQPEAGPKPTFQLAEGEYTFPSFTMFSEEEKAALPALADDEIVAFCPKSTGHANVYNWLKDPSTGVETSDFPSWPGTPMSETNADGKWYKVSYKGYTDVMIIFNGNGQTADMRMNHAGYWWYWESDNNMHDDIPVSYYLDSAKFVDGDTIRVIANADIESFKFYEGETELLSGEPDGLEGEKAKNAIDIKLNGYDFDIAKDYHVEAVVGGKSFDANVNMNALFRTDAFNQKYAYDGNDLGVTYTQEKSTFKVWSPVSSSIKVNIYDTGTVASYGHGGSDTPIQSVEMTRGDKGVFSAEIAGDLDGKYYTYQVTNKMYKNREICDPYARSAGINGIRGMILDLSKTNPAGWDDISAHQIDRKALTVYESHIADLTSSSTWTGTEANRKKFAGFHESGTSYSDGTKTVLTGFDHVKELGVNAVQILPMFDQNNDEREGKFNWGYNPLNYNVPEGQYSSDPYDGAVRVRELKELIKDYHDAGINIIMDVVYNHVAGAVESNFDILFPGYYFRYLENGALSNGSGCGNETASDHYMFRKFMIDSICYWTKEYKLGGFRFDLMGLHDLETMNQLTAAAQAINPSIVIYGEPWCGGASALAKEESAIQKNGNSYVGYGQFNDGLRDGMLKGGLNPSSTLGWATETTYAHANEANQIAQGIKGTTLSDGTVNDPDKTVNYATCHDNYTLHDRIALNYRGNMSSFVEKMAMLCNSIVFTSQGTSFMLSGDEFLRSKTLENGEYDHNSYESSYKTNELNYALKIKNFSHFEKYQKLIALKQTEDALHLDKEACKEIDVQILGTAKNCIVYELHAGARSIKIAHQNCTTSVYDKNTKSFYVKDPATVDFTGYEEIYLDTADSGVTLSNAVTMVGGQTIIAVK